MLVGMLDGLEGRKDIVTPSNWRSLHSTLQSSKDGRVKQLAMAIAQQFGDTEAAKEFLATVKDPRAPVDQRTNALKALAGKQRVELLTELPKL